MIWKLVSRAGRSRISAQWIFWSLLLVGGPGTANDFTPLELEWLDARRCRFNDIPASFSLSIKSSEPIHGRANWMLQINDLTISRSESSIETDGRPQIVEWKTTDWGVRPNIAVAATLSVEITALAGEVLGSVRHQFWLLPRNPFADRTRWLKELSIQLYDPIGKTRAALESLEIPFRQIHNANAVEEFPGKLLIIGESISLKEIPDLSRVLSRLTSSGTPTLCLAPKDGCITLWNSNLAFASRPIAMNWRDIRFVRELDHRLDEVEFQNKQSKTPPRLLPFASDFEWRVDVSESNRYPGWSYLCCEWSKPGRQLIVCDLELMSNWETSPTPRYVLLRLLEAIDDQSVNSQAKPAIKERRS